MSTSGAPRCVPPDSGGFILLPVTLALGLIASIAYRSNRDSGSNVAMVSGLADAEKARYAAEAGLEHASYRLQRGGCLPLQDFNVGGNFGGATYTAHASTLLGSPAQLQSTGTYNGASATLERKNVVVYQTAVQSQTIQPGPGDVQSRDTYLSKQSERQNYGSATRLQVRMHSNHLSETLIRFGIGLAAKTRLVDTYAGGNLVPGAQLSVYQAANANSNSGSTARIDVTPFLVQPTGPAAAPPGPRRTARRHGRLRARDRLAVAAGSIPMPAAARPGTSPMRRRPGSAAAARTTACGSFPAAATRSWNTSAARRAANSRWPSGRS